jgi:uncharacterized protein (DUF924 family)
MHYHTILRFWFKELSSRDWWVKNPDLDRLILMRFKDVHHKVSHGEMHHWRETAQGALAEIIVLDQFSRNIYRGSPKAFAYDGMSLILAQSAIKQHLDLQLPMQERVFFYLPFMHSESTFIHQQAVMLFSQKGMEDNLDFEYKHKEIIDQFGRYPHRNDILGRQSTREESAFLKRPNSSF